MEWVLSQAMTAAPERFSRGWSAAMPSDGPRDLVRVELPAEQRSVAEVRRLVPELALAPSVDALDLVVLLGTIVVPFVLVSLVPAFLARAFRVARAGRGRYAIAARARGTARPRADAARFSPALATPRRTR